MLACYTLAVYLGILYVMCLAGFSVTFTAGSRPARYVLLAAGPRHPSWQDSRCAAGAAPDGTHPD
jgi:hypothetical protein